MSDLTICSHCGVDRHILYMRIQMLPNGNNQLEIPCKSCSISDIIEITPAKQEFNITIEPVSGEILEETIDKIMDGIEEAGKRRNKWIPPYYE
jgi:hypothetical protein